MHVRGQRGRRRDVSEPLLELDIGVEQEAATPELSRNGTEEVTGLDQFLPVLVEEPILTVVYGCALVETSQHVVAEQTCHHIGHDHSSVELLPAFGSQGACLTCGPCNVDSKRAATPGNRARDATPRQALLMGHLSSPTAKLENLLVAVFHSQ